MEPLWTPWRMPYIQAIKTGDRCVFCEEVLTEKSDPDLVIHRGDHAFVVMNLYPYTEGHLMVVPYRHVAALAELEPAELAEATRLLQRAERALETALGARRLHVGINIGRCAGAGVEGHIHIHLVPREVPSGDRSARSAPIDAPRPLLEIKERLARAWSQSAPVTHSATS